MITSNAPAGDFIPVTPSDTADLPDGPSRGLWVDVSGNLTVIGANGKNNRLIPNVPARVALPFSVKRILATGTTATGILSLI